MESFVLDNTQKEGKKNHLHVSTIIIKTLNIYPPLLELVLC